MDKIDAAEKEAGEVLRSLLSVERIEKRLPSVSDAQDSQGPIVVVTSSGATLATLRPPPADESVTHDPNQSSQLQNAQQWHTPVQQLQHSIFSTISDNQQATPQNIQTTYAETSGHSATQVINSHEQIIQDHQVIWQGHTINIESTSPQEQITSQTQTDVTGNEETVYVDCTSEDPKRSAAAKKKKRKLADFIAEGIDPTKLEDSATQVRERFEKGCECQEENCFKGLNAEFVYRHRLNIAELTKAEHDMYLMGVTMACLSNPEETVRHKERKRLRAQYVFHGKKVCLEAFLYLENCTHYQLKRIRKHVMLHGVTPRIHGNYGKKPHNTFSLDIYQHATSFLQRYIQCNAPQQNHQKVKGKSRNFPIYLPADITRKTIHTAYKEHCERFEPNIKVMGYSTFRHFMKEQFSHVKFCKPDKPGANQNVLQSPGNTTVRIVQAPQSADQRTQLSMQNGPDVESQQQQQSIVAISHAPQSSVPQTSLSQSQTAATVIAAGSVQQVAAIPIVVSATPALNQSSEGGDQQPTLTTFTDQVSQQTFVVTPVSQIIQPAGQNQTEFTTCQLHEMVTYQQIPQQEMTVTLTQPTITVTTVPASQAQPSYAFARL